MGIRFTSIGLNKCQMSFFHFMVYILIKNLYNKEICNKMTHVPNDTELMLRDDALEYRNLNLQFRKAELILAGFCIKTTVNDSLLLGHVIGMDLKSLLITALYLGKKPIVDKFISYDNDLHTRDAVANLLISKFPIKRKTYRTLQKAYRDYTEDVQFDLPLADRFLKEEKLYINHLAIEGKEDHILWEYINKLSRQEINHILLNANIASTPYSRENRHIVFAAFMPVSNMPMVPIPTIKVKTNKLSTLLDLISDVYDKNEQYLNVFEDRSDESCPVCLEKLNKDVRETKCNHLFHRSCILTWLKHGNNCPLCKTKIITTNLL
uniref:E3 ubiquitin-protein ligase-like protein n=1 Tax=Rhinella marina erythrocytic-like virus TaxID=2859906 RepID=A0A8F6UB01_9VIRU|nr:E3 ubiquitin-protein ligase-like protein [Rhinella marina erythrocytic-like virus]